MARNVADPMLLGGWQTGKHDVQPAAKIVWRGETKGEFRGRARRRETAERAHLFP